MLLEAWIRLTIFQTTLVEAVDSTTLEADSPTVVAEEEATITNQVAEAEVAAGKRSSQNIHHALNLRTSLNRS